MAAVASGALVEASPTDEDPIIHSAEGVFAGWGDPAIEKGGVFTAVGVVCEVSGNSMWATVIICLALWSLEFLYI